MKYLFLIIILIGCKPDIDPETCQNEIVITLVKQRVIENMRDSLWLEWYELEKHLNKIQGIKK